MLQGSQIIWDPSTALSMLSKTELNGSYDEVEVVFVVVWKTNTTI